MNTLAKPDCCSTPQTPAKKTAKTTTVPRYQIRETAEAFTVTAQVPGVSRETLETTVDGDKLTLVGRRSFTAPAEWTAVHREISSADYRLVLELDQRMNREGIKAELSQGVLTLTLPKAEAIKPRRIEILG